MADSLPPIVVPPDGLSVHEAGRWAARNLAQDEADLLALRTDGPGSVRCWINPPSVILGLSRRIALDVYAEACAARGVPVLRRCSGGGTVYHDRAVLNISWHLPWRYLPGCGPKSLQDPTTTTVLGVLMEALQSLGIPAPCQTRISDVSAGTPPRKVAGSGQARKMAGVLHHLSVLVELDLPSMEAVLPIPPDRPGVPHQGFVTSLRALGYGGSLAELGAAVRAASEARWGPLLGVGEGAEEMVESLIESKYLTESWTQRL